MKRILITTIFLSTLNVSCFGNETMKLLIETATNFYENNNTKEISEVFNNFEDHEARYAIAFFATLPKKKKYCLEQIESFKKHIKEVANHRVNKQNDSCAYYD